jgi:hypothetical protein
MLGQSWFGVRLFHVRVIAGSTKDLAAEITLLAVHITDLRSAVGALGFGWPLAGIAVSIFYSAHQDDLAGTRRHIETLTNFFQNRAEVLSSAGVPAGFTTNRCYGRMKFCND